MTDQSIATGPDKRSGPRRRMATRAIFLLAGLGLAAWAPLVPFAKGRLDIDDGALGLLLLCLGLGSVVAMPLAGMLAGRLGCRAVIMVAASVIALSLPCLVLASSIWTLALALAVFGAGVGSVDVTVNIQAVAVEKEADRSLMSGFHGLFTLGSIIGAGGVSLTLGLGVSPLVATCIVSGLIVALLLFASPNLLSHRNADAEPPPLFALPKGRVLLIAALCFVMFLAEGVVLDWGALFLIERHETAVGDAGIAYTAFAIAMTIGRFTGDATVRRLGSLRTIVSGALLTTAGFVCAVLAPTVPLSLLGFSAVGLGAANIVPVLFSAAGRQSEMPPNLAMSAATTLGYAGILVGPAAVGLMAHQFSLTAAILMVAAATCIVALLGREALTR